MTARAQVFGVTRDPFIIWTSNMFAIASLRALYGLVANVLAELRFLEKAIAIVLAWIGAKMIIEVRALRRSAIWQRLTGSDRLQATIIVGGFVRCRNPFSGIQSPLAVFYQCSSMELFAAHSNVPSAQLS